MPPPQPASTPLELLTRDLDRIEPYVNQFWGPLLGGTLGFLTGCFVNFGTRRPFLSGIQKHIGFMLVFGAVSTWATDISKKNLAERDAILRRYVELHPDDFSFPERKKFAEVLNPWVPIR